MASAARAQGTRPFEIIDNSVPMVCTVPASWLNASSIRNELSMISQGTRPFEIIDNSFLIEEAFNQDAGTVQTIGTVRMSARNDWESSLTQEWPLLGHTHQVSYSIPYAATTGARGVGDVMLNYRFQLMGDRNGTPAFSPRLSLILPTGSSARGLGEGGVGWQMNLPFSEQA